MNIEELKNYTIEDRINIFNNIVRKYISDEFYQYLIDNKFFEQVASSRFHGDYIGGLFDHSYCVMITLCELTEKLELKWKNERSPYIIGMFHDLCKIDEYRRNKNGEIIHTDNTLIKGHGEKSCMLLSQYMSLTEEEMLCIRYHMGAFKTEDWDQFSLAIKKCENVLWAHTADMYASKLLV